jgi:hypothetical protein
MEIIVPTDIENSEALWVGPLLPPETTRQSNDWPVVRIGRPRWWPVSQMGKNWQPPAGNHRYGLVQFVFSINPMNTDLHQVQFDVHLIPDRSGKQSLFYDLFPRDRFEMNTNEVVVGLGPQLKFAGFDASLAKAEAKLHFKQIESFIRTSGIGTEQALWAFQSHDQIQLQGCRAVYAVIQILPGTEHVRVILNLSAAKKTKFGPWTFTPAESFKEHMSFTLE